MRTSVGRLRGRKAFSETFRRGRAVGGRLVVVFVQEAPGEPVRVGFTTARAAGGPVKRNRIRRRLRAAFAGVAERVRPGRRVVILGKVGVLVAPWPEVVAAVEGALRRAGALEA